MTISSNMIDAGKAFFFKIGSLRDIAMIGKSDQLKGQLYAIGGKLILDIHLPETI